MCNVMPPINGTGALFPGQCGALLKSRVKTDARATSHYFNSKSESNIVVLLYRACST